MTTPVTRKESNSFTFECSDDERIGGWSKRSVNLDFFDLGQLRHLVKTTAADDADANSDSCALLVLFAIRNRTKLLFSLL